MFSYAEMVMSFMIGAPFLLVVAEESMVVNVCATAHDDHHHGGEYPPRCVWGQHYAHQGADSDDGDVVAEDG